MAYNTKPLVTDIGKKSAPQYFSVAGDTYEVTQGDGGSLWVKVKNDLKLDSSYPLPAGTNVIGSVKLTDGTDALLINTNGSINVVQVNSSGVELFTVGNPGVVSVSSMPEVEVKNDSGNPLMAKVLTDQTATLTTAPVTRLVTLTETPVALNSKSSLKEITVRNTDLVLRARIGETGMTPANGKGIALEPAAIYQESFDPTVAVTIYGRSEGAAVIMEVYEA